MSELLSLTRAARLVGVTRAELLRKIKRGEMFAPDGMVSVESLLDCYPDAQLEDDAELKRITYIKERAFGKRVFEHVLPDAEVLAARITEQSKTLASSQAQVKKFNLLFTRLNDKFSELKGQGNDEARSAMENLETWIRNELSAAMEFDRSNPMAIKDSVLRIMTAQVTVLPSKHDFLVEGQDTLLEAAMRAGIPLNYGYSGGNCGLCKAKVVSGQIKQTRHHDFVISEAEKIRAVFCCAATRPSAMWCWR